MLLLSFVNSQHVPHTSKYAAGKLYYMSAYLANIQLPDKRLNLSLHSAALHPGTMIGSN